MRSLVPRRTTFPSSPRGASRGLGGPMGAKGRARRRAGSGDEPPQPGNRGAIAVGTCTQVSALLQTLRAPEGPFLQSWRCLSSWVSSSRQAVAGVASTTAFFLCEGLLGQHFDVVPNGVAKPQPGDLFLFPLASGGPGWWGAHAGVYCGDGEIIHLEGSSGTSPSGVVAKHGKSHLLRTRGPAKVLRRKGGLDAAALQRRVRAAMDQALEYDAVTCNCVHFALALLGLGQLAGAMVGASIPGDSEPLPSVTTARLLSQVSPALQ
ncbi:uncharacterized protein LOC135992593 [Caloenas nicobarica]|uniref:uncharacterized protein LOC135992593 n=1 Tax=Caloenas nicobarica TaxID=187106 RepID=UPI0032B7EF9F